MPTVNSTEMSGEKNEPKITLVIEIWARAQHLELSSKKMVISSLLEAQT